MQPNRILFSALTKKNKRVKVQILKDFPRFNLMQGEVAQVKPTVMINYLHRGDGARYIMDEARDVDVGLYEQFKVRRQQVKDEALKLEQERKLQREQQRMREEQEAKLQLKKVELGEQQVVLQRKRRKDTKWNKDITVEDIKIPGLTLNETKTQNNQ